MLDTAKQVLDAVDEAQKAQDCAEATVDKAIKDITEADIDLTQIHAETYAAQSIADKSVNDIKNMQDRLDKLKKKFTENELNAKKSDDEAVVAGKLAGRKSVENDFDENEKRLKDFSDLPDKLNAEMEQHLKHIEDESSYFSGCQG